MTFQRRVIVDEREKASGVPDYLRKLGLQIDFRLLEIGDYVVSADCVVERKAGRDFSKSLYSGRLFDQTGRLRQFYDRIIVVVEGETQLFLSETQKPRVFWGALATLAFQFGTHVFFTANQQQTADLIYTLTKRACLTRVPKGPWVKPKSRARSVEKMQLNAVTTLPSIGPKLAERALQRFGTVRRIFIASTAELCTVNGMGRVKAERITKFLDARYGFVSSPEKHATLDVS